MRETSTSNFVVEAAQREQAGALSLFFERNHTQCRCQWWHFEGDKNAWLERCAHAPELNQQAFDAQLAAAGSLPLGVIARTSDSVIGWMKLARVETIKKLYDQRLYRGLACFDTDRTDVATVACFLVDEEYRRQGVARKLLAKGIDIARTAGIRALEAFPRRTDSDIPAHLWLGPLDIFEASGFQIINDFRPYPVLRLDLT
jgi:GNAT superfamily N-acetyltransferase